MRSKPRMALFLLSSAIFMALFVRGLMDLHPVGEAAGLPAETYGNLVNSLTVPERHITNAVTAVNFDFRGFDTLGEESIMFASVMGLLLLFRRQPDEHPGSPREGRTGAHIGVTSDAAHLLTIALVGPTVLFGLYVLAHGQVTPGGGFQGGVILAMAPLLVYVAGEFDCLRRIAPPWLMEAAESAGAAGYLAIGAAGVLTSTASYLYNFLPLGRPGDVLSGGMVPLIDFAVGVQVAGGFLVLLYAFLERTLVRRKRA